MNINGKYYRCEQRRVHIMCYTSKYGRYTRWVDGWALTDETLKARGLQDNIGAILTGKGGGSRWAAIDINTGLELGKHRTKTGAYEAALSYIETDTYKKLRNDEEKYKKLCLALKYFPDKTEEFEKLKDEERQRAQWEKWNS